MNGTSGIIDSSFGMNGVVETEFNRHTILSAIDVHSSGRIYAIGTTRPLIEHRHQVAIARYLPTGMLDVGYNNGGKVYYGSTEIPPGSRSFYGLDMFLEPNERLVFLAFKIEDQPPALPLLSLVRFNADATMDQAFGSQDISLWPSGASVLPGGGIVAAPNGDIIVCSHASDGFWLTRRRGTDGSLDTGFGTGGYAHLPVPGALVGAFDVVVDPDSRIVVAGRSIQGSAREYVLLRFSSQGVIDTSFGSAGTGLVATSISPYLEGANPNLPESWDESAGLVVQADGKVVMAMSEVIARYDTSGALDPSFGSGGIVQLTQGGVSLARAVALSPEGAILVAGRSVQSGGIFVHSYHPDGNPDQSFNADGRLTTTVLDDAYATRFRPDGDLLIGGRISHPVLGPWFALLAITFAYERRGQWLEAVLNIMMR
jgi:uncharacterized delta-60 repeat protein